MGRGIMNIRRNVSSNFYYYIQRYLVVVVRLYNSNAFIFKSQWINDATLLEICCFFARRPDACHGCAADTLLPFAFVCLFVCLCYCYYHCVAASNGGCSWTCELLLLLLMRQEKQSHQGLHRLPTVVAKQNNASSNYSSAPTRSWNTTYKQCRWTYNDVDVYFTTKEKSTTTTLVFRSVPFFLSPPPSSTTTPYSPYSFLIFLFFNTLQLTTTLIIISF